MDIEKEGWFQMARKYLRYPVRAVTLTSGTGRISDNRKILPTALFRVPLSPGNNTEQ